MRYPKLVSLLIGLFIVLCLAGPIIRNLFGFTFGGPIIKDRTFFSRQ